MTAPDHFAEAELNILRRRGPSTYDFCNRRGPSPMHSTKRRRAAEEAAAQKRGVRCRAACGKVKLQDGAMTRRSERKATMTAVIVYRFQVWDQSAGEYKLSRRMATRKGLEMCNGTALEDTAIEIDSSQLEREEEWTTVFA